MDLFSGSFGCFNGVGRDRQSDPHNGQEANKNVKIWVLKCSRTGFVHYLEAYKDFVDLLLGFLMLRTGALIKLNRQVTSVGQPVSNGIYGVYDSFKKLEDSVVIVDKDILLDPFQKLGVSEELQSLHSDDFECCNEDCFKYLAGSRQVCRNCSISSHFSCMMCGRYFPENAHTALCYTPWKPWRNHMTAAPVLTRYSVIQSRSQSTRKPKKEGYVKKNIPFIITNDLHITPFSTSSVADVLKTCGAGSCEDLECNELLIGTSEVLLMVGAALTSSTPLTDVFGTMCNKKTRVFASPCLSPCLSQFPPCQDDDCDPSIMRHPAVRNRAAKKEKLLRKKTCRMLPIRQRVREKPCPREPCDQGVVRSLSFTSRQSQEEMISEQISNQMLAQQRAAERVATESGPNCLGVCPSSRKQQPEQECPTQFSFPQQPASDGAVFEPEPNFLGVRLSRSKHQPDKRCHQLLFPEHPVPENVTQDRPSISGGFCETRKQQQSEQLHTQYSFHPIPASDATREPQPSSSCSFSSCGRQQPDKKCQKLSFQEPQFEEEPEDQPGCSGGFYRQDLHEHFPSQLSYHRHPVSELEPRPEFNSEYSFIDASNSEKLEQFVQKTPETQPLGQTAPVEGKIRQQSASESGELQCQHALLGGTPYSQGWNICHSGRVSQSIVNPLFRETSPSDMPLSRSPEYPMPPPPSPRIVDASLQFHTRPQPRNVTCVPHSVTHAPSIVRRSYPPARRTPRRTSPQRAVPLGKSCRGVVGHFPSVSAAFEQGFMEGPDRSEVQSTTSDVSDKSGFFK